MNALAITLAADNQRALLPAGAVKDTKHRLSQYVAWLDATGGHWARPDLAGYRDYLLHERGLVPASVSAHLSTVRGRYQEIKRDRDALYALTPPDLPALERKAFVDELVARIENAIDPDAARVKLRTRQDRPDTEHLRLTAEQASALLAAPGVTTLAGLRDTAAIALMLCTGVREAELCALDVPDLRGRMGGELALHVREGKGRKERLIPYGALAWALAIVDRWLSAAGITGGAALRGLYKSGERLRPGRLSVRAVQDILARYPVVADGMLVTARPHDLRRTYARRLYEAGVDLISIQQNLGHADSKTTLGYIGALDVKARRPPALYTFDLSTLSAAPAGRQRLNL